MNEQENTNELQLPEEIGEQIKKVEPKYFEIIRIIKSMIKSNENFSQMMDKADINILQSEHDGIKKILEYLISNIDNNQLPITNIVDEVLKIIADNKIELYEIPELINVIHESLGNLNSIKINNITIIIKLLLFILVETKTIHISNQNQKIFFKVIDSSIRLLSKSMNFKIDKFKKCFCFL